VHAAGPGTVAFAGTVAGRGVVSVQHANGLRTTYEPVEPSVVAGAAVAAGAPVGVLAAGHAGCPVAACLHWGLRRGEVYLDPLALLGFVRVRLLPLNGAQKPG
jgi:murein DD-endopeptidase MepM/ murein hydrolase activator NlpD